MIHDTNIIPYPSNIRNLNMIKGTYSQIESSLLHPQKRGNYTRKFTEYLNHMTIKIFMSNVFGNVKPKIKHMIGEEIHASPQENFSLISIE